MKAPLWLIAWVLVLELFLILTFVPGEWTESVIKSERQKISQSLGVETVEWIHGKADKWYNATMIDSGVYDAMHHAVVPTRKERDSSRGMEGLGAAVWPWVENRLGALMYVIYQVFARVALLMVWAPYMLILFVPAVWDGLMSWRIKRTNFGYSSPVIHRYGIRGMAAILQLTLIAFFAPIALNPIFVPIAMMGVSVMIGMAIANFQKRV